MIVLTADHSLMTEYRDNPLCGFFACSPTKYVPGLFYNNLFAPMVPAKENGEATLAQYGLRKVEASLLRSGLSVKVCHPKRLEKVITKETKIVGISIMDPLGIGPVTSSFCMGSNVIPYNHEKFVELLKSLPRGDYKVVVGGPGAWQLEDSENRRRYGIDHVIVGEVDHCAGEIFKEIVTGNAKEVIKTSPSPVEDIPTIKNPSINSLVEIRRGCGRGCKFCDPTTRKARDIPLENIKKEVRVNGDYGKKNAWLHADDLLLYRCNSKDFYPNADAILELVKEVKEIRGIHEVSATHCSLAAAAVDKELVQELSSPSLLNTGPTHWVGTQPGIETGSPRLLKKLMPNKSKPFSPEEWPSVVKEAITILNENYWIPSCTIQIGMLGEEDEDVEETIQLVKSLSNNKCILAPLFFVPLGKLKGERHFTYRNLNGKQWELLYQCWRHNVKQFEWGAWKFTSNWSLFPRILGTLIIKFGSSGLLRALKRYGEKRYGVNLT